MYAVVEIAGKQYKAEDKKFMYVDRLVGQEGDKVEFDKILLLDVDGKVSIGAPTVKGAKINGTILSQDQADKVIIFKKKRRKGFVRKNGHRQQYTKVLIEKISA